MVLRLAADKELCLVDRFPGAWGVVGVEDRSRGEGSPIRQKMAKPIAGYGLS